MNTYCESAITQEKKSNPPQQDRHAIAGIKLPITLLDKIIPDQFNIQLPVQNIAVIFYKNRVHKQRSGNDKRDKQR